MISYNNISAYTNVYLGSQQMSKVYVGIHQVYPTGTKFQASYIGGTSYSAACDGNTTLLKAQTRPSGYEYSAMTDVVIGDCITSVGRIIEAGYDSEAPFLMYESLSSVTIPDSVTTIGTFAFHSCSALSSITIPNSVTTIGAQAFYHCFSLSSIIIPNSVTSIGDYAFESDALRFVEIGSGVTSIGEGAFQYCRSLTSITCNAIVPPTLDNYALDDTNDCPIYCPCQSLELYKTAWSDYASRIQCVSPSFSGKVYSEFSDGTSYSAECDSNTSITYQDVLHGKSQTLITSCIVGDCVTEIGAVTFNTMHNLSSITISDNVTTLGGGGQFGTCNNLKRVNSDVDGVINIPIGVTSIANTTIQSCPLITAVTVHDGVTTIGDSFVATMNGLKTVTIGSGVTSIGRNFIYNCTGLTSITINAVTPPTLDSYAFVSTNNCPIYVPCQSLELYKTAWSDYASRIQCVEPSFDGKFKATYSSGQTYTKDCDAGNSLTEVDVKQESSYPYTAMTEAIIGDCVEIIYNYALSNCSGLTSITIPNSVTTIGGNSFNGCSSLTSITIPNSVTTISTNAFYHCSGLTRIDIPNSVTTIDSGVFDGCTSLTSCTIGSGVTTIGNGAFENCSGLTSVTIGNSVTSIGYDVFRNCTSLTSVTIPSGITSISNGAFYQCTSLISIDIPNGVTSIGQQVFYGCSGLTSCTIGSGVTSIGNSAFYQCTSLTSITVNATTPPTLGNGYVFVNTNNCPIYVPYQSLEAYKTASGWSDYSSRIQAIP